MQHAHLAGSRRFAFGPLVSRHVARWCLSSVPSPRLKWFAVAQGGVGTLIALLILVDWVGGAGWGYPWYALPFALLMIGLATVLRKVAIAALRAIRS
jgi:hypothetical protein